MEVIKWANGKGQKLILTKEEAEDLQMEVTIALNGGYRAKGHFFEVEIEDDRTT